MNRHSNLSVTILEISDYANKSDNAGGIFFVNIKPQVSENSTVKQFL